MKTFSILLVMLLCFFTLAFAQDSLSTKVESVPKVFTITPKGVATLSASRWMKFSDCKGFDACCNILDKKSLQYKSGEPKFSPVSGLFLELPIEPSYRHNRNILITWTIRIEGQDAGVISPRGTLCSSWVGTVTETFKGGLVYSQAFVDLGSGYKAKGEPSVMTIPDGGSAVSVTPAPSHDPTHSGSYLLKSSEIEGGFPPVVKIWIYWKNDTSMIVTSKDTYRSLIVTMLPTN